MNKGLALTILIIVVLVGAFFRIYNLNEQSLWLDEGVTYYNSSGENLGEVWTKTSNLDQSPPGFYFLMHGVLKLFGENEFVFRLIPVMFGLLSIVFLYLLLSAMFNEETALFAAFLLAINPFHIGFSMEARMYVLLALEAIMALYFLYMAMRNDNRGYQWWGLFTATIIAGVYTHNFFFFVLLALGIVFLLLLFDAEKIWGKLLMAVLSGIIMTISYIPWIPHFLKQLAVERYWMAENKFSDVKDYLLAFMSDNKYLLITAFALSALGVIWAFAHKKSVAHRQNIFAVVTLGMFLFVGMMAPLGYSLAFEPILKIRYVVYLVPVLMGLIAVGLYALRRLHYSIPVAILAIFTFLLMPWQSSDYPIEFGEDFRGLVEIVKENPAPVVVHTPSVAHVINFYNKGSFEVKPFPYSDDLTTYNIEESSRNKYRDLLRELDEFYLVVTHTHENPHGLLYIWSDAACQQNYKIDLEGMETYLFKDCR